MNHKRSFISIVLATIVLISLCAVCVSSVSVSAAGNGGGTSGAKTAGVAIPQTLRDGTFGVVPQLSWTQGQSFPVVSGRTIFPTLAPPISPPQPPQYSTHWYAGSDYQGPSETAQTINVTIRVPYSAPLSDEFYYVLLSAWTSNGSYDQLGFSNNYGTWGLTYSWTSGPVDNPTYHYSSNAMALSVGATYTFSITTEGGVTQFIAYQNSTQVWSLDAPTGGNYLVLSSLYSGYYGYTDYEEVWLTDTSGGSPAFDFYFYDNYWVPIGGGENAATWTSFSSGAPSNVAVIINGNSVLVHNPGNGTAPVASSPAVSGQGANSLDLFAKGMNGSLYYKHWDGTAWSTSTSLGGILTSDPAATSSAAGRIDVFVRGNDGGVWSKNTTDGGKTWSNWYSLGGQIPAGTGPAASSWGARRLDLFAKGTDGGIWWKYWQSGSSWSGWQSLGGSPTSSPAATSRNTNGITVFARGSDGAVWYRDYVGSSWSKWVSIGGQTHAGVAPAVSSWGAGRLDVFVQGTNTSLYHKWYTGTSWSGWESLGGILTSSPTAASPASNLINVFVRGNDNFFWEKTYTGSWSGWMSLGGL